jgi:hypothetical protein
MKTSIEKSIYVCGPLTELAPADQVRVKLTYQRVADVGQDVLGVRGFVPHEHYDPIRHATATPQDVDNAERDQVCNRTSCLVVIAEAPSWGGGIEVEMANSSGIPVLIFAEQAKLEARLISRLLRGNPAVRAVRTYTSEAELLQAVAEELRTAVLRIGGAA